MSLRRRRATAPSDLRTEQVKMRLSPAEAAAIDEARAATDFSRAAWLWMAVERELGRGPGPGEVSERAVAVREVVAARRSLDRIGRNLNQAVAQLHATGEVEVEQLRAILDRVDAAVGRVDEATVALARHRGRSS